MPSPIPVSEATRPLADAPDGCLRRRDPAVVEADPAARVDGHVTDGAARADKCLAIPERHHKRLLHDNLLDLLVHRRTLRGVHFGHTVHMLFVLSVCINI